MLATNIAQQSTRTITQICYHKYQNMQAVKMPYLQFVLLSPVTGGQSSEFFCQPNAFTNIFGGDKVKCNLQAGLDLTQHLTAQAKDSHTPPVSALPNAPLSFKMICACQALVRFIVLH
ncbi:hypothetical protein TIFTF001_021685 [Ficus carica]|uniref:Uncharacterized protein n=1 Tax=Ficus carica TaxID=3494 RepID=A0AA88AD67_FICCA|nr:hypothetical protein TIFTF001_021685 [Ficus carica]